MPETIFISSLDFKSCPQVAHFGLGIVISLGMALYFQADCTCLRHHKPGGFFIAGNYPAKYRAHVGKKCATTKKHAGREATSV